MSEAAGTQKKDEEARKKAEGDVEEARKRANEAINKVNRKKKRKMNLNEFFWFKNAVRNWQESK